MNTPMMRAHSLTQEGFTKCSRAAGDVKAVSWLETQGALLIEAMEALRAHMALIVAGKGTAVVDSRESGWREGQSNPC
jgi:hypothetical protein